ncbi:UNVERIFIED_CONTAM: hypothetical protein PYX00_005818 [Menopon gallinae]|uniref:DNA-dependent protein kinase catalytic subunit CC3 domain-containing protein n=1 Tax=Menopon gallinae TaxID=328185 RepID=A0AAW2HSR8_9NEOP
MMAKSSKIKSITNTVLCDKISKNVPVKCRVIIRRLSLYFTERKSDSSVDLLLFLTFGENGITSFIRKVVTNEVSHPNVLSSFQLLEFILVNFEKECIPYVDEVMKLCLSIAQMNVHARVRENSLKLLNCMFAPSYLANLDLSGVLGTICVLKESDPPPSVLMRLFTVIGIILERAPEVSHQYKDEFLGSFVEKIKDVESSNKCETLLSGCFDGVYGYLVHFTAEETVISDIYSSLKKNCRAEVNQKRLVTDRAALKVIIRHHRVFAKYIFEDINSWRETLNYYLKKSGEDRQLGYRGLVSVYRGVACALDEEGVGDREKLNNITEALLECPFDTTVMIGLVELISTGQVRQDLTRRGLQMIMEKSDRKGSIYLSTNLECVSKYLTKPGAIVGDHLAFLRKTAVTLIGDYPNMDSYFRLSALQALERSFYYLGICGRAELDEYAKEVIYQGLIRSCSHQIYQDVELQKDITGQDMISHKSYLPLWLHLTNLSSSNTEMEPFDGKSMVSAKIFDEYLSSVLKIIKKLDLGIRVTNPNITDLELAAEANRPTDFRIFINVVNLFVDVMEELEDGLMMKKWLAMLFTEMTHHSSKKPLISGFYKILAACLKLADKLDFFASCEKMLQRFLRDISFKVGRYKGDLQISCFQVIVQVGSGHFPLLKDCLTALEKWHSGLPKDSMEYLLRNTLPCFDVFLQTKGRMLGDVKEFKSKPLRVGGRVRKLAARETESQLLILQRRFLLFLGKLDQDLLRQLIQPIDEEEEDQDYGKELSYAIPLSDVKLRIKMKELLPRIVELSLSSSDRRTRVTACEFLHSIVLLTLGSMKQMNGELNELFGRLVSVCLVLSCDSDHVIFQIFEPLTTQMAHYFFQQGEGSVGDRNFRKLLVREFADWSLRRREVGSPDNIMTVLQKMYSFSVHPDHNKRCGAATVFNNIYTIIREQTDLIDTHWFLLYYHFMECLSMCSSYDDTTHITTAINLIKASLTKKNFSSPPKVPAGFKSDMTCLMEWIFSRCSHPQMKIRGISMEMVEGMSKGSSVKQFVKDHIKDVKMKPRKSDGDDSWLRYTATLFHYYGWLLHHDVINESHMLAVLRDNETDVLLDKMANFSGSVRASVIIQMLEFVIICIKKGIIWQKNKILLIVKDCLYRPSMLELEDRESLYSILENLFQLLSPSMNNEEIKIFSSVDSSIFSHLQQRLKLREPLTEQMELLKGLEIMYKLNFWNLWKFGDTIRGDELLQLVFDSLFADRRRRCVAVAIDPNEKVFLCDLIRFSLKIGVSSMALWQLLAKGDAITEEDTFQQNTKGGYFTQFFKPELTDYFIETFEPSLRVLIKYHPTKVQETVNEALKHSCRSNVDGNVKEKFIAKLYQEWSDVERMPKENKRVCLLSIVKGMCELDPSRLLRESSVLDWVHDVMTSSDLRKDVEVFAEVLPYLSAVNEEHNQKLTLGLESLYKNLDVKNDFDPALAVLYKGLIKSFARSKSLPVLREMTRIVDLHNRLLKENEVNDVFCETSPDQLRKLAHFLYDELFNRNKVTCESFLRTLLLECDSEFTREFLLDRFGDLTLRLGEADVDKRIRALGIVQICVPRFSKENLEDLPAEKKEIFRSLMMSCVKTLSGSSEDRRFSCACFNTLCAVIAARTNDPRQYKSLIFKEDFPYLSKLVDRERVWSLRMDFDKLPKMRKVFASLRRTITRERQMRLGQTLNSVKYLHEETLFSSSLREDVTKFDYTYVTVRPMKFEEDFGVELEMDALNDHECMATLVGIVEHLVEEKVTPKDDPDTPFWLKAFIQRLKSWNSHENEKIFLMKLMCNLDRYLKPYADEVAPVLLNAVLEVFHQKPINYLVIDVITMVLNWKTDYVGLEAIATRLAIIVINKSDSYRKDIVKSNLELAKLIVESFRDNLNSQLLSTSAFEALGTVESDPNVKYLHLQFSGILLVNRIPAWIDGKEEEFFKMVLVHCSGKSGKIAAEVAGAALQYLERQGFEGLDTLVQMTREKVRFAFTCGDAFGMNVLYAIHKTYPKISSDFLNVLRNSVWVLSGSFKTHGMEMLLSHLKRQKNLQNDPFLSVIDSFIVDMLTPDDLEILALSLQMLVVVLEKSFCWEKMRPAVEKALTFSGCRNLDVRKGLYDLAEYVYSKGEDEELRLHCKMVLLDGMNDSDSGLSERCLKFWRDKTRAPNSAEQFSQILCESYHPNAESGFLSSVARLIISSPATSAEYIFDHPLAPNCSFQKTTILKTAQRSTIAPMFAQTLSTKKSSRRESPSETTAVKKRRFLKDAENAQAYYAKKQMVKKEAELEEQREMTRKLDNHVDIFKEYSSGDIPDIRISHSQFLKPLEALTRDPQIARHFLTALYDSLSEEMTESAARLFCIKIGGLIQHVAEAETPNPTVVGFLFHVLLHCEGRLEVDADCVARLAKSSGWLSVGGLLLEEMLIRAEGEDEFQPRKGETPEEKKWLQLADICRSLKEFEVLRGIFLDKLRVVDEAAEAIHSESVTDWQKAAFYYQSVLKKPQYTTKNDFYAEACFNSLARLSDWSAVNTGIHGRHEVDQLWTDTALYENILPWLLKSEMVLSLQSGNTDALLGLIDCEKESELKKLFPGGICHCSFHQE